MYCGTGPPRPFVSKNGARYQRFSVGWGRVYEIIGCRQLLWVKPAPTILDRSLELLQNFTILSIG